MAWRRPVHLVSNGEPQAQPMAVQAESLSVEAQDEFGIDQSTAEFPEIKIVARPDPDLVPASRRDLQTLGDHDWHDEANRRRAAGHLTRLESALAKGRTRRAEKARAAFMATVHADRIARARTVAREHGLRMDRAGRGPVLDHPVMHHQRRMSWRIYPLEAYHGIELPDRARRVMRTWEAEAGVFDRYYLADEVPDLSPQATERLVTLRAARTGTDAARTAASLAGRLTQALISAPAQAGAATANVAVRPDPCLIGVISGDGSDGDWFILDRWRH